MTPGARECSTCDRVVSQITAGRTVAFVVRQSWDLASDPPGAVVRVPATLLVVVGRLSERGAFRTDGTEDLAERVRPGEHAMIPRTPAIGYAICERIADGPGA